MHSRSSVLDGRDECRNVDAVTFDGDIGTDSLDVDIGDGDIHRLNAGTVIYGLGQIQDGWSLDSLVHIEQQTAHVHLAVTFHETPRRDGSNRHLAANRA